MSFESVLQKVKERYAVLELDDFHREQLLLWEAMGARLNPAHMVSAPNHIMCIYMRVRTMYCVGTG